MRWRAMQRFDSDVRRAKTALSVSPFDKPKKGRIAVKVINHRGDEVMNVFRV
jgi:adenine-specific DNA-methyltransferase